MNNRFYLGRYIALNSFIHRLDARLKLIITLVLLVVSLLIKTTVGAVFFTLATIGMIIIAKVPIKVLYFSLKPILSIILLTAILQVIVVQGGKIFVSIGFIHITSSGLENAISTFLRLTFIVIISTLLTVTTKPLDLADAIEFFMKPLQKIMNIQLWALMFSVAIRFIPTLMMEMQKLMMAQRSRGVRFDQTGLVKKAKAFIPIIIPLMVSTYKRSIDLGTAMTARGFNEHVKRTKFRQLHWRMDDTITLVGFCIIIFSLYLGNHF